MMDRPPDLSGVNLPCSSVLGVRVSAIDMDRTLRVIEAWIRAEIPNYVTVTPAHVVMDAYRDQELCRIINSSGMTTPDGMSIVWLLKLQGYRDVERVYGSDLLLKACRFGLSHNWCHYFYGGGEGVAESLVARLRTLYPDIEVAGTYTPPFRPLTQDEDEGVVAAINQSEADIVWVGLSSPKQERWMAGHLGRIQAPVMIGVGAAFDFVSGNKPQAPRWIRQSGFEWLFRLATEPRRLWPRYRQYPLFVWLVILQLLGLRDFSLE